MERGAAERSGRLELTVGPRYGVVQTQDLADPVAQPPVVAVEGSEPADVDGGQIGVGLAVDDPLGECPTGAARGRDADRVEPGRDEEPTQLGGLPHQELVVGGEALRAVVELADPRVVQGRDA